MNQVEISGPSPDFMARTRSMIRGVLFFFWIPIISAAALIQLLDLHVPPFFVRIIGGLVLLYGAHLAFFAGTHAVEHEADLARALAADQGLAGTHGGRPMPARHLVRLYLVGGGLFLLIGIKLLF